VRADEKRREFRLDSDRECLIHPRLFALTIRSADEGRASTGVVARQESSSEGVEVGGSIWGVRSVEVVHYRRFHRDANKP